MKNTCKNILELGNKYTQDSTDITIYRECNVYIDNCETCSSKDICLSCMNQYGLYNDRTKCVSVNDNKYFKKASDNLYYFCNVNLENCIECLNESECITCKSNDYILTNKKCFLKIPLCLDYDDNGKCIECKIGYKVDENENICKIGIGQCIQVDENGSCTTCEDNYRLSNNKCYKEIDNCDIYEQDESCKKCKNGFAFEENNKLECKDISSFNINYYTKDGGINYLKCDGEGEGKIKNCKICEYQNSNNQLICNECNENYVLKDEINNICYSKELFENDKKYYYEDSLHIKTCSKTINECKECEKNNENVLCTKCNDNYFFVNGDYLNCINKNEITPIDEYFYDEQVFGYFYCLSNNLITDCKKCNNIDSCLLCRDGFTFISDDKNICKDKNDLGNKYFIDENDNTIYRKCNDYINNCDTCLSKDICLTCVNQYGLYNDRARCVSVADKKYYKKDDNLYYLCSESIDNCNECTSETECLNCINNYDLIGEVCLPIIEHCESYDNNRKCIQCSRGYKIVNNGDICKIEIDNCIRLSDNYKCAECEDNYRLSDNVCYKKINNCDIYEEDENCKKCKNGYAFEENIRLVCKNINTFEEYYTIDGISYYKCDGIGDNRINKCKKCEYNNNELICKECKTNFVMKDDEYDKCYSKELFLNDKKYFFENSFNVKTCSKVIDNCKECEKKNGDVICTKCENNYFLVDDDYNNCKPESEIPIEEYYLNDNKDHYYSCGNNKYNSIDNCKKCNKKNSCYLCKEGYTFINNIKSFCEKIEDLGNHYIPDVKDISLYRKCSYYIPYCDTCSSKDLCLSCLNQHGLYNDKSKCVYINDENYFKNSRDGLYYLCSNSIKNCEKCVDKNKCNYCINGYIKINNDRSTCHLMSDINIDEYYVDPNDNNMYMKCSSYIDNCLRCEYEKGCKICKYGYILLNDDYKKCNDKSTISLDTYFTEDGFMYYSCNV